MSRYVSAVVVLAICMGGGFASARAGLSRLFSEFGSATDSLKATEQAVSFAPGDPEARYAHASQLEFAGKRNEAVAEFAQAISLRSADYFLWQELGRAREEAGDNEGAIVALRQAIELAPYYSQPHWQLGNLLLRDNQLEDGFSELRHATQSDPSLFPAMTDLAWGIYEGDAKAVLATTKPLTDDERVLLARFLLTHNRINEGLDLLRPILPKIAPEDCSALAALLISAEKFQEAYEVWSARVVGSDAHSDGIFDGGFERSINSNEQGFGWKPTQATQTVQILVDANAPQSGTRSLRLDYAGYFSPAVPVISQLVLVAPQTRYRLSFTARAKDLRSAGLPLITVKTGRGDQHIIAQISPFSELTEDWREFAIDFEIADTNAITINIQRQICSSSPCPIFGHAWFDTFSLKRL